MPGKNKVVYKVDPTKIKEDMWNIVIVVNNTQPVAASMNRISCTTAPDGMAGEIFSQFKPASEVQKRV